MIKQTIDMSETGKRIKAKIIEKRLSLDEIATILGLESTRSVYSWINGQTLPRIDNLVVLLQLFECGIFDIIVLEDSPPIINRAG